jgi:quinol monooxygenase YgiN
MLAAAQIVDITDSDGEVTQQIIEQLGISIEDHVNMLEVVSVVKTEVEDTQEKTVQQAVVIISAAAMENITNTLDAVGEEEATQTIIVLTSYYSQILASINHHIATSAIDDLIDRVNELVSTQAEASETLINIMAQKEWALAA